MNSQTVDEIEGVRTRNNRLWMLILRIALDSNPVATKAVLAEINDNDRKISHLLGKLADE